MATIEHITLATGGKNTMTAAEAAEELGVTKNTLAIWRYYRRGPSFFKCGRSVVYLRTEIAAFMEANLQVCNPDIRNLRSRR